MKQLYTQSMEREGLAYTPIGDEFYQALAIVLDFVERWNKQDKEAIVAQAASELSELLEE